MKVPAVIALLLFHATTTLAQCEAPVPCQDPELNRLNTTDCQTYHAFLARGSDSGYPGHLGGLIKLICNDLSSENNVTCGYSNVVYPANSTNWGVDAWCKSAHIGATAGQKEMTDYANRCPDAKLIVLGFSQGGSVALDMLGGGGGAVFECTQEDNGALDPKTSPGSKVVAAAVFGAVRRSANQTYDVKEGKPYNGRSPRSDSQLAGLNKYASILRSYCNEGDPMCAVGSPNQDAKNHLDYFTLYNEEAAKWVIDTAKGQKGGDSSGNGGSSSKSASASTATSTAKSTTTGTITSKTSSKISSETSSETPRETSSETSGKTSSATSSKTPSKTPSHTSSGSITTEAGTASSSKGTSTSTSTTALQGAQEASQTRAASRGAKAISNPSKIVFIAFALGLAII